MELRKALATGKARAAILYVATGIAILGMKVAAYAVTGSVALLSDAAESVVNVFAASVALASIVVATFPPDKRHQYGHSKAEHMSSATEAALIASAGFWIVMTGGRRLLQPQPLEQPALGLLLLAVATLANLAVALALFRAARSGRSAALDASARHLMSDVVTSCGVFAGVTVVVVTGRLWLDAAVAMVVGAYVLWMGLVLLRRSVSSLMDASLPPEEEQVVRTVLEAHRREIVNYHALRTRRSGSERFLDLHLVLHRDLTVGEAHDLTDRLEESIEEALPRVDVTIHVEPCEAGCRSCAGRRS